MGATGITTESQLAFAIFCIEAVADELGKDPRDVYRALSEKSDILDDYVVRYYDALHTQDKRYIADDIIRVMTAEGVSA